MTPGKNDFIKVDKMDKELCCLYHNISETFGLYKLENPKDLIGHSKFAGLHPKDVRPFDSIPHTVCVCSIHENMNSLIEVITKARADLPSTAREVIDKVVCRGTSSICMRLKNVEWPHCKSPAQIYNATNVDISKQVSWFKWGMVD